MTNDLLLAPPTRLALAYVPLRFRSAFGLLLQIDERFSHLLRTAREPMIAQIKMAWWREAFANSPELRPKGEPLLQALNEAGALVPTTALEGLATAWEELVGREEFGQNSLEMHVQLRAEAIFQTYADWVGSTEDVGPIGRLWAANTLQSVLPDRIVEGFSIPVPPLPKSRLLRPLTVLTMSLRPISGPRLVLHALTGL